MLINVETKNGMSYLFRVMWDADGQFTTCRINGGISRTVTALSISEGIVRFKFEGADWTVSNVASIDIH